MLIDQLRIAVPQQRAHSFVHVLNRPSLAEVMDKQNEVLLNTFVISKKKYRVVYNAGVLVWEAENSKKGMSSYYSPLLLQSYSVVCYGECRFPTHSRSLTHPANEQVFV